MLLTQTEQVLLSLIKQSLFGICEKTPSEVDWIAVLREAQQQAVVGLAAAALPEGISQEILAEWKKAEYQQLGQQIRYWAAQDQLHRLLTENGISYVILKGASAAMLYPAPLRRAKGDIDFLVPPEQLERTKELLLENDYQPNDKPNDTAAFRHIGFSRQGISYELHQQFSYLDLDLEDILQAGLSRAKLQTVEGHAFYSLPNDENGLVLLAHLWNHLHTGIGLRQVIDWMLYVHRQLDDEAWNIGFSVKAENIGLDKLAIHAAYMCRMYLGLPDSQAWYANADENLCKELFAKVIHDGNFGRKNPNMDFTARKAQDALSGMHRYGFIKHLQSRGETNWTLCHKHAWLRPFAWIYQLFRYLVLWIRSQKRETLSNLIKGEIERDNLLEKLS